MQLQIEHKEGSKMGSFNLDSFSAIPQWLHVFPETTNLTFQTCTHFDTKWEMHTRKISMHTMKKKLKGISKTLGWAHKYHISFERLLLMIAWLVLWREQQQCKSQWGNPKYVHRSCCIVGRLQTNWHLCFHCVQCTLWMLLQRLKLWPDSALP